MKKQKIILLLAIILFLGGGIFLRVHHLGVSPYWMDEGYTVNAVNSELQNGTRYGADLLDSGETYFCPLYCTPTSWIVQLAGQDSSSYRILSVLFGVIMIVLTYFLTESFFGLKPISLLSTFFVSFSYSQIAWSRQARWYSELEVFFWLTLWLFYLFLKAQTRRQKYIYFATSILSMFLAIATHRIAYLLPVIGMAWYVIEYWSTLNKKRLALAGALTLAAIAIAEFVLGFHFISHALKNVHLHYTLPYYLNFYLRNYWMFFALVLIGYFNLQKAESKKKFLMLGIPFLLYLFFLSFFTDIVHYRYLFHTTVALYILGSVAAITTLVKLKTQKKIFWGAFALITVFFITPGGIVNPQDFYSLESDDPSTLDRPYYAYTPQPDFNAAYDSIKTNLQPQDIVISSHPHFNKIFLGVPGYWIKYNYLGMEQTNTVIHDDKEYYVNALVIDDLTELQKITAEHHGYIVYDYMATDGKIPAEEIEYIQKNFTLFFSKETNSFSKIWVYKF